MKNIKLLITVVLSLVSYTIVAGQSIKEADVFTYFKKRIADNATENILVPFDAKKPNEIKKDLPKAKQLVWEIWRKVNQEIETLPTPSDVGHSLKIDSISVHQWELIGEDPMPYYFIKKGKAGQDKHALFLNLHGSGPKVMEFKNTLAWTLRYRDAPSLYFIPQIPNEKRYRWWLKPVQYSWERLFRLAMLNDQVDVNKMYIMGISEGGYGSQRLAAYYADYLAGAGPMAGGEPLRNAPPLNFRNIAFSFQTGENDHGFGRNTLTLEAKKVFEELATKYDGDFIHKIELQANRGHGIDYTVTTPWLVQYDRRTRPKRVSWMLFPMDGRYRKGFYNIGIDKAFDIQESDAYNRVGFDITYSGNTVYIDTKLWDQDMMESRQLDEMAISIFLDEQYVDLSKKIKVLWNGKQVYNAKVKPSYESLIESCALFGDPERLYPVKIRIDNL